MSGPTPTQFAALRGRRVLVVEDEYIIAQETTEMLSNVGAETLGPVPAVADACQLLAAADGRIDAALLDVSLRGEAVWPLVDELLARRVPVVLATGFDAAAIPPRYAALPRCEKPVGMRDLTRALERVLVSEARM